MTLSLKAVNRPTLILVLLANLALFFILMTTGTLDFQAAVPKLAEWQKMLPATLAVVASEILTEFFDPIQKARMVFWRWTNPYPGAEAFTVHGPSDPRIQMGKLRSKLGTLPHKPAEQNQAWYSLYRTVKNDIAVASTHRMYLLYRDYTCVSVILFVLLLPMAFWQFGEQKAVAIYGAFLFAQYMAVRQVAKVSGVRFIKTTLAVAQ